MSIDQESADRWDACPEGALVEMNRRLRRAQRRRDAARVLGASGLGVVLVAGILLAAGLLPTGAHLPGGISCSECREHLVALHDAETNDVQLTAEDWAQMPRSVQEHLAGCRKCREKIEAMRMGDVAREATFERAVPVGGASVIAAVGY